MSAAPWIFGGVALVTVVGGGVALAVLYKRDAPVVMAPPPPRASVPAASTVLRQLAVSKPQVKTLKKSGGGGLGIGGLASSLAGADFKALGGLLSNPDAILKNPEQAAMTALKAIGGPKAAVKVGKAAAKTGKKVAKKAFKKIKSFF